MEIERDNWNAKSESWHWRIVQTRVGRREMDSQSEFLGFSFRNPSVLVC